MGTNVFLSYARENAAEATRLEADLTGAGLQVWFDKKSLKPGARWASEIEKAIRGCRYFIALISSASADKRGFIQKEIRHALDVLQEFPEDEVYLIPVRIDDCKPPHPRLADLNWTDLFPSWDAGLAKLLAFFGGDPAQGAASALRYDGLYESPSQDISGLTFRNYLRFYSDGTALGVTSSGTAEEVARWLTKDYDGFSGVFELAKQNIRFSLEGEEGVIDYEGRLLTDSLVLKIRSHINGNRDVRDYEFVSLTS